MSKLNAYTWETFEVSFCISAPKHGSQSPTGRQQHSIAAASDDEETEASPSDDARPSATNIGSENSTTSPEPTRPNLFEIRHFKAGRTGARKTWDAAPVLLRYLTTAKGGLTNAARRRSSSSSWDEQADSLDMDATSDSFLFESNLCVPLNILELGGGSGFVSVGLAKAFEQSAASSTMKTIKEQTKILCADMDPPTLKNMRFNVQNNKVTKMVAVEKLIWGEDIGGDKFRKALERTFKRRQQSKPTTKSDFSSSTVTDNDAVNQADDSINLITHVIWSDLLFGEATTGPLSSIIAALKHSNRNIQFTIICKERSPNTVANLVDAIESKFQMKGIGNERIYCPSVIGRNLSEDSGMKLIEC